MIKKKPFLIAYTIERGEIQQTAELKKNNNL